MGRLITSLSGNILASYGKSEDPLRGVLQELRWVVFDQKSFGCISLGTQTRSLPLSTLVLQGRLGPSSLKWLCHLPGWDEMFKMVMVRPKPGQGPLQPQ